MDYARIRFSSCWHSSAVVRPMISAGWQEKCAVGAYIPLFLTESKWWGICEMEFVYKLSNFGPLKCGQNCESRKMKGSSSNRQWFFGRLLFVSGRVTLMLVSIIIIHHGNL